MAVLRVLSGMQPTGVPHLGNYLGALRTWVKMQDYFRTRLGSSGGGREHVLFMVADLHSLTVHNEPEELGDAVVSLAATMLACGVDPAKATIFQQSRVPAHAELAWVLQCNAPLSWMQRMTQFKDKVSAGRRPNLGLLAYPTLMAADILLYKATHVPVGDDQTQHLEITRDLASRMNEQHKREIFVLPEPIFTQGGVERVMSLRDGTSKMSKSDPSPKSRIDLDDSADEIARKIRKAKTDTLGPINSKDNAKRRPEVINLVNLLAALEGKQPQLVLSEFDGHEIRSLKETLAEAVVANVTPIGAEIRRLKADRAYLEAVLAEGSRTANQVANGTLTEVYEAMGLRPFNAGSAAGAAGAGA